MMEVNNIHHVLFNKSSVIFAINMWMFKKPIHHLPFNDTYYLLLMCLF